MDCPALFARPRAGRSFSPIPPPCSHPCPPGDDRFATSHLASIRGIGAPRFRAAGRCGVGGLSRRRGLHAAARGIGRGHAHGQRGRGDADRGRERRAQLPPGRGERRVCEQDDHAQIRRGHRLRPRHDGRQPLLRAALQHDAGREHDRRLRCGPLAGLWVPAQGDVAGAECGNAGDSESQLDREYRRRRERRSRGAPAPRFRDRAR